MQCRCPAPVAFGSCRSPSLSQLEALLPCSALRHSTSLAAFVTIFPVVESFHAPKPERTGLEDYRLGALQLYRPFLRRRSLLLLWISSTDSASYGGLLVIQPAAAMPRDPSAGTLFDISGRKRDFLTKEVAKDLFKPLGEPGNSFKQICLSNWSFGKDAALLAGEAIETVKGSLEDANLADIVAGRPEAEALEVMAILSAALAGCKLESLNLSDNALGEKGVRAFSALLKSQKSLQRLYFINNGISEGAARAICELLSSPQDLHTLHFHNNMSGDGGAQALSTLVSKAPVLRDFQFSSTRVASDGGMALVSALGTGNSLRRIDLRDNMFGPEVGVALSGTLRHHPDLEEAYLSDIGLEDEGAVALSLALEDGAPNLKVLELGGNEITAKAAYSLAACIKAKPHLSRLNLTENELKDRGAGIICESLQGHPGIAHLDLSSNYVRDAGALAALKMLFGNGETASSLEVNLQGNFLSEDGVKMVERLGGKGETILLSGQEDADDEDDEEEDDDEDDVNQALEAIGFLKL